MIISEVMLTRFRTVPKVKGGHNDRSRVATIKGGCNDWSRVATMRDMAGLYITPITTQSLQCTLPI